MSNSSGARNILLLSAGRRVALAQAFRAAIDSAGRGGGLICGDMYPGLSSACIENTHWVEMPHARSSEFGDALLAICADHNVGLVVPTIDTELMPLAKVRDAASRQGTSIIVSDEKLVSQCRDKRLTKDLFRDLGVRTPEIYHADRIVFPCFSKPAGGSSSIGALRIDHPDQITTQMRADPDRMFMELVGEAAREVTIDLYYDRQHRLSCCVPRERIEVRAGEVSKGVTRRDWVYDYLVPRMQYIEGARGCLTLQVFADDRDQTVQAIEINPRFGGGYPLSWAAKADFPSWIIAEYLHNEPVQWFDDWEPNLLMLRYDAAEFVRGW